MIELGLARITQLLQYTALSWRAIHVAGTNGKGSVCAYASAMLNAGGIKCGRFTSPHLINKWDCIVINEKIVDKRVFDDVEAAVVARNNISNIKASEFELLTATAFEIFDRHNVEIGIIEVGLGGKRDATNVLQKPLVTVITKIGKDHQNLLGDSLIHIASEKAGIMKKGVPCIVDATNSPSVLKLLMESAKTVEAGPITPISHTSNNMGPQIWNVVCQADLEVHQQTNISLAVEAVRLALLQLHPWLDVSHMLHAIPKTQWPGRLQRINIEATTGRKCDVILDGAHNVQSAEALCYFVNRRLRINGSSITWVMAFSKGKEVREILSCLIRPGDNLVASSFSPVEGMPWAQPAEIEDILFASQSVDPLGQVAGAKDANDALRKATDISNEGPLVIAGSLYQVSDVLRLVQSSNFPLSSV